MNIPIGGPGILKLGIVGAVTVLPLIGIVLGASGPGGSDLGAGLGLLRAIVAGILFPLTAGGLLTLAGTPLLDTTNPGSEV
jgi:hypothetical protein